MPPAKQQCSATSERTSNAPMTGVTAAGVEMSDAAVTATEVAAVETPKAPSTSMAGAPGAIGAEGRDAEADASCQLGGPAVASQAGEAYSVMTAQAEDPRRASNLKAAPLQTSDAPLTGLTAADVKVDDAPVTSVTAAAAETIDILVTCVTADAVEVDDAAVNRMTANATEISHTAMACLTAAAADMSNDPVFSVIAAAMEINEAPSTSMAAAAKFRAGVSCKAEQRPSESEDIGQRFFRGPSIQGSSPEAGRHFKKRRWSLLLVTLSPTPQMPQTYADITMLLVAAVP